MDSAVQRKNMVDSQVRPSDVTDRRIARAMLEIPREAFVPEASRVVAYMDGNLAVGGGEGPVQRVLLAPRTLSKMIQQLSLEPDAAVLDVAPATGYSTAVLARIARRVVAVESDAKLAEIAKAALGKLSIANAEVQVGALGEGVVSRGPYDAILINGKVSEVPAALLNQLKDGGRLVAILDFNGVGKVCEWRRFAMNFDRRAVFDAEAPVLPGFERTAEFVF
ncbi:MAG: protein-L-isoaspartate O-methyltransferase [Hyphomicrobiaceae bacterium]